MAGLAALDGPAGPAAVTRLASGARPWVGVGAALLAAFLFALNGTVSKIVLQSGISTYRLVQVRSAGAAVCLLVVLLIVRPSSLKVGRSEIPFLVAAGLVGIAVVQWLYFVSIHRLDVGIALLLEYLAPVLVALWVRFVGGGEVSSRVWLALALSVGGLAVVAQVWQGLTLDGLGVTAGLASAVSLAAYYLTGEHGLGSRDVLSLAAWMFTVAALFWACVLPWWTFPWSQLADTVDLPGSLAGTSANVGLLVGWIIVLGTVAPYALVLVALGRVGSARTGLLCMAEPVLAAVVAWSVLDESLAAVQVVGGVIVLVGIVLAETSRRGRPDRTSVLPEGVVP
jgi:drug/metabolite transporter (DMT)-like permease